MAERCPCDIDVAPVTTPPIGSETRGPRIQSAHGLSSFEPESTRGSLPDTQAGKYGGREHLPKCEHESPVAGERAGGATPARSNGSLLAALRTDRLYVESSETPDYTAGPFGHWLTCSECGWDGPMRREFDRPTRDWWRHPLLVCLAIRWRNDLRYWWSQRSWRRPISPCNQHGHTWAWVGIYGPKSGEPCYCGRAKWRTRRV